MPIRNSYPEKPVELFHRVSAEMGDIIAKIKKLNVPVEVKRAAYIIVRNETVGVGRLSGTN
jgi:hypothetical protein